MRKKQRAIIPADLRERLEVARLDTLALMRTMDLLHLADHLANHPTFVEMYELDADCAEALKVLLEPPGFPIDWAAMVRDTELSLREIADARERVRQTLDARARQELLAKEPHTRGQLEPEDAYDGM